MLYYICPGACSSAKNSLNFCHVTVGCRYVTNCFMAVKGKAEFLLFTEYI